MDKDNIVYVHCILHTDTHTEKHTMEYCSAMKKEGNFAICNNMDEPGWYYV